MYRKTNEANVSWLVIEYVSISYPSAYNWTRPSKGSVAKKMSSLRIVMDGPKDVIQIRKYMALLITGSIP